MNEPTHLDLFSGIGGFALAAQWAGFRTIGFCEIEPFCCRVIEKHWPNKPNYGDIRAIPAIHCDLITGGFPCQPFSVAGKQRGKDDDRYLWPAMLDVISQCQPHWVLAENVAAIEKMALSQVLTDLESISYQVTALVIPACAVGAIHKRERVFIIANSSTNGCKGIQQCASSQVQENGALETLDAWHGFGSPFENWEKLMAESFVRRMDDGISSELDVRPRLRAYGNAIVPQVAYEILREIRKLI